MLKIYKAYKRSTRLKPLQEVSPSFVEECKEVGYNVQESAEQPGTFWIKEHTSSYWQWVIFDQELLSGSRPN